jgi:DNA-binding transcriptional LysR family regulator
MDYTLNQLRIFLKVVELKSVTRASEALHLTQPGVSIQLKKFQDQFEIPLTEVVGRQLYVTPFGEDIAAVAGRILAEVETIKHKTLLYKKQLVGQIRISVVSTGKYVMPFFLADFMHRHPGVDLKMDVTNKSEVVKHLDSNEVDFALVSVLPDKLSLQCISLLPNKLFLVGGRAFSEHKELPEALEEIPLIFREKGSATRAAMERYLEMSRVGAQKRLQLSSNEAVKQAVVAGLGVSVMPIIGLKNELANGDVHILPPKGLPLETTWNLVWLNGKRHSPAAEAYLKYVREETKPVIEKNFDWIKHY